MTWSLTIFFFAFLPQFLPTTRVRRAFAARFVVLSGRLALESR